MRRKGRTYIGFLLGFLMMLSICIPAAAALPGITVSAAECIPGETVSLSVSLSDNPGIVSMTLDVEYDSSALVLTDIIDTGTLPGQMHTDKMSSPYRLTWMNDTAASNFNVNGTVVNLVFKVSENAEGGTYPVRIRCPKNGILNYDIKNVEFQMYDGEVNVKENSASASVETHEHTMLHIREKAATCSREGNSEYWLCTSCGKKYSDPNGSAEASAVRLPVDPNHHDGGTILRNDKKATAKREGYTGDTYCLDCYALLKNGKVIPVLEDGEAPKENDTTAETVTEEKTETELLPDSPWVNPFTDVYASDSYYEAIRYVYENGLFKGVSETEFAPDVTMTRAMFVTVLGRMNSVDIRYYSGSSFNDAVPGEWYAPYVEWAAANKIVQGYGNGIFGINDKITVEQAAAILARYASYIGMPTESNQSLTAYTDAGEISGWAAQNMQWVVEKEIYTGAYNKLNPQSHASRSLVATMLHNFSEKNME